jgi:hypothetical protein
MSKVECGSCDQMRVRRAVLGGSPDENHAVSLVSFALAVGQMHLPEGTHFNDGSPLVRLGQVLPRLFAGKASQSVAVHRQKPIGPQNIMF